MSVEEVSELVPWLKAAHGSEGTGSALSYTVTLFKSFHGSSGGSDFFHGCVLADCSVASTSPWASQSDDSGGLRSAQDRSSLSLLNPEEMQRPGFDFPSLD